MSLHDLPALPEALLARLRARHAEPQRHYHTQAHIDALLRHLQTHQALAREPRLIEAAIWFHDCVYDPKRDDNEARSAAIAREELTSLGWPAHAVDRVEALVLATHKHDAAADDADAWLFLDLDLSVLGQPWPVYDAYRQAVRQEYRHVLGPLYRMGRRRVLQRFAEREAIYRTPQLHALWDAAARANLQRELKELGA
jgi:predicted metal-dependent HD superfamily phosphohydrolase